MGDPAFPFRQPMIEEDPGPVMSEEDRRRLAELVDDRTGVLQSPIQSPFFSPN